MEKAFLLIFLISLYIFFRNRRNGKRYLGFTVVPVIAVTVFLKPSTAVILPLTFLILGVLNRWSISHTRIYGEEHLKILFIAGGIVHIVLISVMTSVITFLPPELISISGLNPLLIIQGVMVGTAMFFYQKYKDKTSLKESAIIILLSTVLGILLKTPSESFNLSFRNIKIFIALILPITVLETAWRRWKMNYEPKENSLLIIIIVLFFITRSEFIPVFIGMVALSSLILLLINYKTLLYDREMSLISVIFSVLTALLISLFTSIETSFILLVTAVVAGIIGHILFRGPEPERKLQTGIFLIAVLTTQIAIIPIKTLVIIGILKLIMLPEILEKEGERCRK